MDLNSRTPESTSYNMSREHDIRTLNDLLETTFDSIKGYESAAEEAGNSQFASMFRERAQQRRQIAEQLQQQVRVLGGTPEDSGSMMAAAHRMFMDMKNAFSRGDRAVIEEVERGEDVIRDEFQEASSDSSLSLETRQVIAAATQQIRSAHDEISRLKHSGTGDR